MDTFKSFETERLILKPSAIEDADFVFALLNSPKWLQYIGDRDVKNIAAARAYIEERMLPQLQKLGYGNYICIRKSDHAKMGSCGLYAREGLQGVDIGFAFLPEYEGMGYAYEPAKRIKVAAFQEFNIPEIKGFTTKDNFSSQKLLEKLGMTVTGTTFLPNDEEELLVYYIKNNSIPGSR